MNMLRKVHTIVWGFIHFKKEGLWWTPAAWIHVDSYGSCEKVQDPQEWGGLALVPRKATSLFKGINKYTIYKLLFLEFRSLYIVWLFQQWKSFFVIKRNGQNMYILFDKNCVFTIYFSFTLQRLKRYISSHSR